MYKHIVYLHIQKTAGNSIHLELFRRVPGYISLKADRSENLTVEQLAKLEKWYPGRIGGIGGHRLNWESVLSYLNSPTFLFTIFRDPVDRYLSFYHHIISRHHVNITLDEYLNWPRHFNLHSQSIGITGSKNPFEALHSFNYIGFFDQIDKTNRVLSKVLNTPVNLGHINSNQLTRLEFSALTEKQQQKCVANNALDIELYSAAKEIFDTGSVLDLHQLENTSDRYDWKLLRKLRSYYVNHLVL